MSKKEKQTKKSIVPSTEKVARSFLAVNNEEKFTWAIRSDKVDWQHKDFGFHDEVLDTFSQIIKPKLDSYSSMTWAEIITQRKSCHSWDAEKIDKPLLDRLSELHKENSPETLYQIDLDGKHRIWGYKEKSIFYLLFNDPEHKGYKVNKRNT